MIAKETTMTTHKLTCIFYPEDVMSFFDVPEDTASNWLESKSKKIIRAMEDAAYDIIETEGALDGLPPVD